MTIKIHRTKKGDAVWSPISKIWNIKLFNPYADFRGEDGKMKPFAQFSTLKEAKYFLKNNV